MKKFDLHIHTKQSIQDSPFDFSMDKLKEYVEKLNIDCIAITNHNFFDLNQFNTISENLNIVIFPGIEINIEKGHLLLISDNIELDDFELKCSKVNDRISKKTNFLAVQELKDIFIDLHKYLLIPHYDKDPMMKEDALKEIEEYIKAGEVSSHKKFIYCCKNQNSLVPVIFSDLRISETLSDFSVKQTFIDLKEITFRGLKGALSDRSNVSLSRDEGNDFFVALENGLQLSTGLNVILGERSSGKTYTLDSIYKSFDRVKYIKQFSLLERDEKKDKKKFDEKLGRSKSRTTENFLEEYKKVVDDITSIDLQYNEISIEKYLQSLIKSASEHEQADSFSKANLYNESLFAIVKYDSLKELINSVNNIIENTEYKHIVSKHISIENLKKLSIELMEKYNQLEYVNQKKGWLNDLIKNIKKALRFKTSATIVEDINFYDILMDKLKIKKFTEITETLQIDREITREDIQGYNIIAKAEKYKGAFELQKRSGKKHTFSDAFNNYDNSYKFLCSLKEIEGLEETEYYKYFVNTEYKILNKHGFEVSGGERSEFNLLEAIKDALQYDILLIDEPESSFDNIFLMKDVNKLIKDISLSIPVVLVTHNNTVGASIHPNYLVYTKKEIINGKVEYSIYTGYPTAKKLISLKGKYVSNYSILLNCLEAGAKVYKERGDSYENIKS